MDGSSPGGATLVTDGVITGLPEPTGVGSPPVLGLFAFSPPPGVVGCGGVGCGVFSVLS